MVIVTKNHPVQLNLLRFLCLSSDACYLKVCGPHQEILMIESEKSQMHVLLESFLENLEKLDQASQAGSHCNYKYAPLVGDQICKLDHICRDHTYCSKNIQLAPEYNEMRSSPI